MRSHAQVVVIGGGVVGCSVLYHLTKAGWKDVVLIERDQLTSGSTWHAAGGFHTLNGDPNVAKLQGYTIGLYDELERISGQSCGLHRSGGLLLADTPERMEWLKMAHGRARYLGLETAPDAARGQGAAAPDRGEILRRRHAGCRRRQSRSLRHDTRLCEVRANRRRGDLRATRVTRSACRPDGTWDVVDDAGQRSTPST